MSLIPGVIASGISGHLFSSNYVSIATATATSGGTGTISFTSIPSTYTHLQLRLFTQTNNSSTADALILELNGDSTAGDYNRSGVYGTGSSAGAYRNTAALYISHVSTANSATNEFGVGIIDILDYANSNKYKMLRGLGGYDTNGSGDIRATSGLWQSTTTVNRLDIIAANGTGFNQYTQIALYGVK